MLSTYHTQWLLILAISWFGCYEKDSIKANNVNSELSIHMQSDIKTASPMSKRPTRALKMIPLICKCKNAKAIYRVDMLENKKANTISGRCVYSLVNDFNSTVLVDAGN